MVCRGLLLGVVCVLAWSATLGWAALPEDSWPTFRGPPRTAVSPDIGLLTEWPTDGPKLLWQAAGAGRGYSSLAIAGGRIYTLGDAPSTADDEDEYLVCFDQTDGKQLWKTKTGPAWNEGKPTWQSSRSTPTVTAIVCMLSPPSRRLDLLPNQRPGAVAQGPAKEFEGKKADGWGYSESVLIDGDKLVCTPGGPTNTMVALEQANRRNAVDDGAWPRSRRGPCIDRAVGRRRHARLRAIHRQRPNGRPSRRRQAAVDFRHRSNDRRHSHAHRSRRPGLLFAGYGRGEALLNKCRRMAGR